MKILKNFLFIYNFILIFSLFYQGIRQYRSASDLALLLMLASSVAYFLTMIVGKFFKFENKLDKFLDLLKITSLITTSIMLAIASFGLIFRFEYIFIIIIFPLPLYFLLKTFYKEAVKIQIPQAVVSDDNVKVSEKVGQEPIDDPLKRKFLKIIGGSGLGILLLAIFKPKSAEAAFFGSIPSPGTFALKDDNGNKIDPAIKSPTDAYGVTQIDDSTPAYYGFVNKVGAWYITREDNNGSYRYIKGIGNFSANWSNRSSLTYDYFDAIF